MLAKGFLTINSFHVTATVNINVVIGNNPTAADFTTAASTPANTTKVSHPGHSCLPLDLSTFKGAANNTNATIQLVYNGGDSPLYQCADVVLVTTAASFNQSQCIEDNGTKTGSNPSPTGSAGTTVQAKGSIAAFLVAAAAAVVMAL